MKDKKTPITNISKIPNDKLFVEYYRQMKEKYPEFCPEIDYASRRYSGKLYECLKFYIVCDDNYEAEFMMFATLEPKNGKIKCTLDYYSCHELQSEVDFDESDDVSKMNIRNVILAACDLLDDFGSSKANALTVKALLEDMEKQNG